MSASSISAIETILLVAASSLCILYSSIKSRITANLNAIDQWFSTMDINTNGQRYQGARCQQLFEFYLTKRGLTGLSVKRLYRTKSGRYFEIEITADLSDVVYWKVTPVTAEDALAFMEEFGEQE